MNNHKKILNDLKKMGKISECFCHRKHECKGSIKQAHSIQKNGRLSIIEGTVNGNQMLYPLNLEFDDNNIGYIKPIGKSAASTFFGFCDYHDTQLFSPVENFSFDDSDKHCFLHSYRAFAHSYHKKKEELKRCYSYQNSQNNTYSKFNLCLDDLIGGIILGIKDGEHLKNKLDSYLDNEQYSELYYFSHVIPHKYPIACTSVINPYCTYSGVSMNNQLMDNEQGSFIMLTVLPDTSDTIIIFSYFPEDIKAALFIDELEKLPNLKFEKAISSILIYGAENTFFAPALWNKLGEARQKILQQELMDSYTTKNLNRFFHSSINFFDREFRATNLGI